MHITTIKGADGSRVEASRPTDAELQNEYNYILAENFTKKLLEKGLISVDEGAVGDCPPCQLEP